jgi:hypothetical protein
MFFKSSTTHQYLSNSEEKLNNKLTSVVFLRKTNTIELKFESGLQLTFLSSKIAGLKSQKHSDIESISLIKKGSIIRWSELDLEVPVVDLCQTLLKGEIWSPSENS